LDRPIAWLAIAFLYIKILFSLTYTI
jgi:hypothetical protein